MTRPGHAQCLEHDGDRDVGRLPCDAWEEHRGDRIREGGERESEAPRDDVNANCRRREQWDDHDLVEIAGDRAKKIAAVESQPRNAAAAR